MYLGSSDNDAYSSEWLHGCGNVNFTLSSTTGQVGINADELNAAVWIMSRLWVKTFDGFQYLPFGLEREIHLFVPSHTSTFWCLTTSNVQVTLTASYSHF